MQEEELKDKIEQRVDFLESLVNGDLIKPTLHHLSRDFIFLIARKWNSWYPSYFQTLGGCYAIITRDISTKESRDNPGVIVIDPGFRFLDGLRTEFSIEPHDIRSIVVSHFHPDHMAGLLQFLTLTSESSYPCNAYLNETSYQFFKIFEGERNRIHELSPEEIVKLADYEFYASNLKNSWKESLYMRAREVHHSEIGNKHHSLGLIFDIIVAKNKKYTLAILGDTDGNPRYIEEYIEKFSDADILVLHLGSFVDKNYGRGDKHLYREGLRLVINSICENKKRFPKLRAIILSEIGLEMARLSEIVELMKDFGTGFMVNSFSIFCKIIDEEDGYVKKRKEKKGDLDFEKRIFSILSMRCMEDYKNIKDIPKFAVHEAYIYNSLFLLFCHLVNLKDDNIRDTFNKVNETLKYERFLNSGIPNLESIEIQNNEIVETMAKKIDQLVLELAKYSGKENSQVMTSIQSFAYRVFERCNQYLEGLQNENERDFISHSFENERQRAERIIISLDLLDENTVKNLIDVDFRTRIHFLMLGSIIFYKKPMLLSKAGNHSHDEEFSSLKEILSYYRKPFPEKCKFFIGDMGFQLRFTNNIEVKDKKGDWIKIEEAEQEITDGQAHIVKI